MPTVNAQLTLSSVQNPQEKVTSIVELLKQLELMHKTSFVYQKELLANKNFSGQINETDKLEQVLERILTPANLRFKKLKGGGYTILPNKASKGAAVETRSLKKSGRA